MYLKARRSLSHLGDISLQLHPLPVKLRHKNVYLPQLKRLKKPLQFLYNKIQNYMQDLSFFLTLLFGKKPKTLALRHTSSNPLPPLIALRNSLPHTNLKSYVCVAVRDTN